MTAKQKSKEYAKTVVRVANPEKPTTNEKMALSAVANDWLNGYNAAKQELSTVKSK